jgi:6-hydroxycyclohex-1-ene-1-carbonyl-CoA dehydrogenase
MMPTRWIMVETARPLEREAFDIPALEPAEVLVEIAGCGVCHTDLGYYYDGVRTKHPLPLVLGHEISGRVIDAGSAARHWLGRPVIVPAVIPCGQCEACRRGNATICPHQKMPGNDIHGGFASHVVVPSHGLCEVDEARLARHGLTLADVSVVADAVTTPYQAVVQAGVQPGDVAVVVGAGGVGGYAAQIAAAHGASVVAIDVADHKLSAIAEHGAKLTLNAREHDLRALKGAIDGFAREQGVRASGRKIFECSGTAAGQQTAFGLINHGATLAVVGFTMDKVEIRLSNLMAFHARALGNWGCPPELYPEALALVLDGRIKLAPFVEQRPLESINEVFHAVHAGEMTRRPVLVPGH